MADDETKDTKKVTNADSEYEKAAPKVPEQVLRAPTQVSPSAVVELPEQKSPQPAAPQHKHKERGGRRSGDRRGGRREAPAEEEDNGFSEKLVHINRCAKVVKGGRRFSFSALVVVGNREGQVGVGYGKAKEVPECIRKGTEQAHKNLISIELKENTIPHEVTGEHDGGKVLLRPASPGTGVIAGGGVRAVLESCGIRDVLSKSLRSNNPGAVVFATLDALKQLRSAQTINQLRKAD